MPAIACDKDKIGEHFGTFNPGIVTASTTLFNVAGDAVARIGDEVSGHSLKNGSTVHKPGKVTTASTFFNVDNKAVARKGDTITCGGTIDEGSNFFNVNA